MRTGLKILFLVFQSSTILAQSGGIAASGNAPVTHSEKKVKTKSSFSYKPGEKKEKMYTDSFSTEGLKIKWTNHLAINHSLVYPGYTIRYEYDSLRQIKKTISSASDTSWYRYDIADSSVTKWDVSGGKILPSERHATNELGDTILYLHYSNGIANSGWKYVNQYQDGKKKTSKYYVYAVNFYDYQGTNVHPRWDLRYSSHYYYSAKQLVDSIIYFDEKNIRFKNEVCHYDKSNLLIKKETYFTNGGSILEYFKYDNKLNPTYYTVVSINDKGEKTTTNSTKWKYNKYGLVVKQDFHYGKRQQVMKYEYTYY